MSLFQGQPVAAGLTKEQASELVERYARKGDKEGRWITLEGGPFAGMVPAGPTRSVWEVVSLCR